MTKIIKVSMVLVMGSSMLVAGANQVKLYEIKSGKIEYGIKGSTDMMGMKIKTIAKKRVIFDNYGAYNLTETNEITKQTMAGTTKTTKDHTLTYMKEGMLYQANFEQKRIIRMQNPTIGMGALMGGGQNMKQSGEDMMLKMGAKKIGTDKVLDYTCDVWDIMGVKQCLYKGIPLKIETNIMGMKSTEIATKAEFDISISKDDFKLPDFPVYNMDPSQPIENQKPLDKSKLDAMDKQAEMEAGQASEQMGEMRTMMATAAKDAGIKEGERPTKAQEETMRNSMMEAMLPRMKKEILDEEKMMRFGYECLGNADTLKEANICNDKANAMGGEAEEPFDEWSPATKKEILGFLDQYLNKMVPCIKKAQTMQDAKQCMPRE